MSSLSASRGAARGVDARGQEAQLGGVARAARGAASSPLATRRRSSDRRDAPTDDERKRTAVADELRRRGLPVPRMPLGA